MLVSFSAIELGLDFNHKITLELQNKYKIVFNDDGTSKSYIYKEFKHLVKDEPKYELKYNTDYRWVTASTYDSYPIDFNSYYNFYPIGFSPYNNFYQDRNHFKFLGIFTKEILRNTHPDINTIAYCNEDDCIYLMTLNGWELLGDKNYLSNRYSDEPIEDKEIKESVKPTNINPTFHEESYWEYVEVEND